MIQRIQTLYLLISVICLGIVSSGITLFTIAHKFYSGEITSFGRTVLESNGKLHKFESFPLFILSIATALLALMIIFNYKKLKLQLSLTRFLIVLYLLNILIYPVYYWLLIKPIDTVLDTTQTPTFVFYIFLAGFPFTIMALLGIRKDKKLLDSLNRLR